MVIDLPPAPYVQICNDSDTVAIVGWADLHPPNGIYLRPGSRIVMQRPTGLTQFEVTGGQVTVEGKWEMKLTQDCGKQVIS